MSEASLSLGKTLFIYSACMGLALVDACQRCMPTESPAFVPSKLHQRILLLPKSCSCCGPAVHVQESKLAELEDELRAVVCAVNRSLDASARCVPA